MDRHGEWHDKTKRFKAAVTILWPKTDASSEQSTSQIRSSLNIDHHAVIGVPQASSKSENKEYTKKRTAFPLQVPRGDGNQADRLQKQLIREARQMILPLPAPRDGWISQATWNLIDQHATQWRNNTISGNDLWTLNSQIRRSLWKDRRQRTEDVASDTQTALQAKKTQTAWDTFKRWYCATLGWLLRITV
jgi:predicted HNH restriction endonuclease